VLMGTGDRNECCIAIEMTDSLLPGERIGPIAVGARRALQDTKLDQEP
jgi:hypothetical protein